MAKKEKSGNPIVAAVEDLRNRIDVLIAFYATQSTQSDEQKIKLLNKMDMSYDEIEKILGVSSATISKVLKNK